MAADTDKPGCTGRSRKRKTPENRQNFCVGTKVEVRSLEEGFLGSWHPGTVIACHKLFRQVKYDNLLCDDGSQNQIESVNVTPTADNGAPSVNRDIIRPSPPPPLGFGKWCLHYGQCVDLFHLDAWWEGVIFDHEEGSVERTIFFPDMGDELKTRIELLRITQDWDEVTESWKPRGNWLFLQMIEEVEQEWPPFVSARQIWYDVRVKNGFDNLKDWTSTAKDVWKDLVFQVVLDNYKLTLKEFVYKFNSSWDLADGGHLAVKFSEQDINAILQREFYSRELLPVVPFENGDEFLLSSDINKAYIPPALTVFPSSEIDLPRTTSDSISEGFCRTSYEMPFGKLKPSKRRRVHTWHELVPEAEYSPDAISEYYITSISKHRPSSALTLRVRKHLAYLGWKIEVMKDKGVLRHLYTSPQGKCYFSLLQVCQNLREPVSENLHFITHDETRNLCDAPFRLFLPPCAEKAKMKKEEPAELSPVDEVIVEPKSCPEALLVYYSVRKNCKHSHRQEPNFREMKSRARKHLSAAGWSFYNIRRVGRRKMQYRSPSGNLFYSLRRACKDCIDEKGISGIKSYATSESEIKAKDKLPSKIMSSPLIDLEFQGGILSQNVSSEKCPTNSPSAVELAKVKDLGIEHNQDKRKKGVMLRERKETKDLVKLRNIMSSDCSTRVLRSSKRVRQMEVPSSSHQLPHTILSWLIENNVVLPRAKVRYQYKKDGHPIACGRITHNGIKCSCCQNIFTPSKFEAHAGSNYHQPSANIFLEDGRSLMDCQFQLRQQNKIQIARTERQKKGCRHPSKNDYICSVCHCGGELLLCDQCPSAFHTSCLGLKEVPDGDWFCPSCCCGICCQSKFSTHTRQFTFDGVLSCYQCAHQFHIGCLKKKGLAILNTYPKGIWFCNKRCQQIFLGLQRLLGKPVPVGTDNLTWTLLKYTKPEWCSSDGSSCEVSVEHYSKLNVAIGVMHECFEPVKERRTRRDLVEDIIFNRWSELNRLNFQGFYTVLLERNDELITVAILRVYGEKVAEVPLVGTCFQYRRLGMCRILMNEIEKELMNLGVERLVLPAVPSVLNTWTSSFGFEVMTDSERLNFLDYTFLDFQGTVMCQKLLMELPSRDLRSSKGTKRSQSYNASQKENSEFDVNSAVSEVFQADQVDENGIVDQGPTTITSEGGDSCSRKEQVPLINQGADDGKGIHWQIDSSFKCYKRRISGSGS